MILKRGSKVPVELKRSKNSNQSNSNNTKEKKNKKNKKKKKKNGDNDTNNANGNDDANTTGDNAKSEGNTTNEKGGGKKNTKNSKNSKNSKTPKKKKKKKELTEEEKQQLAVQRAELVKKNRASQLSKEIRSLSLALEDSVLGRITEIIEMCFNENMTPEVSSLEAALLFCAKSGQLRDALIILKLWIVTTYGYKSNQRLIFLDVLHRNQVQSMGYNLLKTYAISCALIVIGQRHITNDMRQ